MKKKLFMLLVLCSVSIVLLGQTNHEIAIKSVNRPLRPRSLVELPKVYLNTPLISISFDSITSLVFVRIISKKTGELVISTSYMNVCKHSKKCTFYTLRFGCSFAAVNTIKPQLL